MVIKSLGEVGKFSPGGSSDPIFAVELDAEPGSWWAYQGQCHLCLAASAGNCFFFKLFSSFWMKRMEPPQAARDSAMLAASAREIAFFILFSSFWMKRMERSRRTGGMSC